MPFLVDPVRPHLLKTEVARDGDCIRIGWYLRFEIRSLRALLDSIDPLRKTHYEIVHVFTQDDAERLGRKTGSFDIFYEPQAAAPLRIGDSYFTPPMIEELKAWLGTQR